MNTTKNQFGIGLDGNIQQLDICDSTSPLIVTQRSTIGAKLLRVR